MSRRLQVIGPPGDPATASPSVGVTPVTQRSDHHVMPSDPVMRSTPTTTPIGSPGDHVIRLRRHAVLVEYGQGHRHSTRPSSGRVILSLDSARSANRIAPDTKLMAEVSTPGAAIACAVASAASRYAEPRTAASSRVRWPSPVPCPERTGQRSRGAEHGPGCGTDSADTRCKGGHASLLRHPAARVAPQSCPTRCTRCAPLSSISARTFSMSSGMR